MKIPYIDVLKQYPLAKKIASASAWVIIAMFMFKFLGLIQARLIGGYCAPITRDLFSFSFDTLFMGIFLLGEESFAPVFLPIYMNKLNHDKIQAMEFASTAFTFHFILVLLFTLICGLFPVQIVSLLTAWNSPDANPIYMELAPDYIRYMSLGLFGMCLSSLTYMLLNSRKDFFLAAVGDAVLKFCIVISLVSFVIIKGDMSVYDSFIALSLGVVAGSFFKLFTHVCGLRRELKHLKLNFKFSSAVFKKYLWLVLPLLIGVVFARFRDIFNQVYILSNIHEEGLIAANIWGRKIYQAISAIIPYALSIVIFPYLCELNHKSKEVQGKTIAYACVFVLIVCTPISAMVCSLSQPLSRLIYETGKFTLSDCSLVAVSTFFYTLVLPFYALEMILMQAYFSKNKTYLITVIGIIFSVLSIAISALGILYFKFEGEAALIIVAGGYTFSRILKTLSLVICALRKKWFLFNRRQIFSTILIIFLISTLIGMISYFVANVFFIDSPSFFKILIGWGVYVLLYLIGFAFFFKHYKRMFNA